ncbi:MAG TPA: hypothetical protein ENJ38_07545 [Rhodospirillales bacterium]|nr:hypothetical protein [Rhodospirillales bacterium]
MRHRIWPVLALVLPVWMAAPSTASAQEESTPPTAPAGTAAETGGVDEIQALIERMRKKVEDMNRAAAERDKALEFLEKQVEEATKVIGTTTQTTEALREKTTALSSELEDIAQVRDRLSTEVSEREKLLAALEQRVAALTDMLGLERPDRYKLGDSLEALRTRLDATLEERDELARQLAEAKRQLAEAERQRASLEEQRAALQQRLAGLEEEGRQREQEAQQRIAELGREIQDREARLAELEQRLGVGQERIRAMNEEIARLNRQLAALKDLLGSLDQKLQEADLRNKRQQTRIADLTLRLNAALAKQVEELKEYRSEFFGRLKKALGDRPDIKIVGDRFVLQAELLFPSGSANLDPAGEAELEKVAESLKEVMATIPPDIDWVLRVDGHTDKVPLRPESIYRSNWELSTARALTVVEFLIDHGIPPERLVAAGFGEYQPIDPGDSEEAYRRNRRIEFKLTER